MAIDPSEARALMRPMLSDYRHTPYRELLELSGHRELRIKRGASGTSYTVECFIDRPLRDDAISVTAIARETRARGLLRRQVSMGFRVSADGSVR